MDVGCIGLGEVGINAATRLPPGGDRVVAHDVNRRALRSARP